MRKNEIYVLGSINIDLTIFTNRVPNQGETITGKDFMTAAGGKGANQAVAAAKIGNKVNMIGAVGNDYFQKQVIDSLLEANVNIDNVKVVNDASTGVAIITRSNGDNRIVLDPGANYKITTEDVDKGLKGIEKDIFISQFEIPMDVVKYGLIKAKEQKMITIVNPAPVRIIEDDLYQYIDYLVVNQSEAELLTGIYPHDLEDSIKVYEFFKLKGLKTLVVTLGESGSAILNGSKTFKPAHKIKPIDTTGAGDAFIGAFAHSIINGFEHLETLEFSNSTSALVCLKKGAQQSMPNLEEINKFRKEVRK